VLVLGGTGLLGAAIAEELLEVGRAVRILARNRPERPPAPHLEFVVGRVEDPMVVAGALADVDWVVHAVGCPPPASANRRPDGALQATVPGLLTVLDALKRRPGTGLTYLSSGGTVYGNAFSATVSEHVDCSPVSAYGVAKLAGEKYIGMYANQYGIPVKILRVANAYGPRQSAAGGQGIVAALLAAATDGTSVDIRDGGTAIRDFIHVDDVAWATARLRPDATSPRVVNVGTGRGRSVLEVLRIVESVTGEVVQVNWTGHQSSDVHANVLDVRRLGQLVGGWDPVDLETGVARTWAELGRTAGTAEQQPA
jgi:UDP-glucose 4-epimerase